MPGAFDEAFSRADKLNHDAFNLTAAHLMATIHTPGLVDCTAPCQGMSDRGMKLGLQDARCRAGVAVMREICVWHAMLLAERKLQPGQHDNNTPVFGYWMENVPAFIARTQQTEVNRVLQLFDRLFHLGPTDELLFHDASWTGDAAVRVCRLWTNLLLPELWELCKGEQRANDVRTAQAWVEFYSPALSTVTIGPRSTCS